MQDPEFVALDGRGKVPILEDGELVLGESGAIVLHLADAYRESAVLAPEPASAERARFYDLCLYTLMELDAPLYIVRRHAGLAGEYGEAPVAVASAKEYFLRGAARLERLVGDGRPFVLGDAFCAADILVASCLAWAKFLGLALPPGLETQLVRVGEREGYRCALARNFPPEAMRPELRPG
jgi:glutathione S-transferase